MSNHTHGHLSYYHRQQRISIWSSIMHCFAEP